MQSSYLLSKEAETDWRNIVEYTYENFGARQVKKYTKGLLKCLDNMAAKEGPYKTWKIKSYKVRSMRCEKHIIFSLKQINKPLLVIAIFHEQMDLMQRLRNRI